MRRARLSKGIAAAALLLAATVPPATAVETIDLNNPSMYANQARPAYIRKDNTTAGNAITNRGATLGRILFYDKRLSSKGTVSCASCHQQSNGFADTALASQGVNGTTGRHSMRLINARFGTDPKMFWDERAATVEAQTTLPIRDHGEMGFSGANGDPSFSTLIARLQATAYYPYLFNSVYGDPVITEDRMQRALAQFVRSIQSFDAKYDTGRAQVANDGAPFPNFTASENNGKQLFLAPPQFGPGGVRIGGGAGCAGCHRPPEFDIDPNSLSNGVIGKIGGGQDLTVRRSPTLRNLVDPQGNPHGAFMHDGSFVSLAQVVGHYNAIPNTVTAAGIRPAIDPRLLPGGAPQRLQLTAQQNADIVAFLRTLSGPGVYTDARWSDPFDTTGTVTIAGLTAGVDEWLMY